MRLEIKLKVLLALFPLLSAVLVGCDYYQTKLDCSDYFEGRDKAGFTTDESGLAKFEKNGVIWYRCAAGQRYSNFRCKGEPLRLSWDEANEYATEFSQKSGKAWRLPSKQELKSIMEEKCINPSVNPTVFPGLEVDNFWTSSGSLNSDLFRCSVYTYRGDLFCRQPRVTELPFLLVGGAK